MAKPSLSRSQRLASSSFLICIIQTMPGLLVKGGDPSPSSVDVASCDELQCANHNVCQADFINGTQVGHARCLCRGQWAGFRCRERISLHVAEVTSDSVTLRVKGRGPPDWGVDLNLGEQLLVQELSLSFWNRNQSGDCNVIHSQGPESSFRVGGLGRGQTFLFCIGNGPSDLCSNSGFDFESESEPGGNDVTTSSNCVEVQTKYEDEAPLDIGLIIVPVACFVCLVVVAVILYIKRSSLFVQFLLHYFCCRACYHCRRRCLRKKLQKMRKESQQQQLQQRLQHDSSSVGVLLSHDGTMDDSLMNFDLASTSLSSSALEGNRSSIKSDSYRSARSVDSDATMPPAYQDEVVGCSVGYGYIPEESLAQHHHHLHQLQQHHHHPHPAITKRSASQENFPTMTISKRKISDVSFDPDPQNYDVVFRRELPHHPHPTLYPDKTSYLSSLHRHNTLPNGGPTGVYRNSREQYFRPSDGTGPQPLLSPSGQQIPPPFLPPSNEIPPYQAWLGETFPGLPHSETFPSATSTLPRSLRIFPNYSKNDAIGRRSTIIGIRRNSNRVRAKDAFFRTIDPSGKNDPDNLSLEDKMLESSNPSASNLNSDFDSSTFPRHKKEHGGGSSTLPRMRSKKKSMRDLPHEFYHNYNPIKTPEISTLGPFSDVTAHPAQQTGSGGGFDWLSHPPRVPAVPQTAPLPSSSSFSTSGPTAAAADDVAWTTSTNSKEDKVPKKRMKSLIGHFERSLPFRNKSSSSASASSSRPNSVHWEDEVRDLTSPLAVERSSSGKGKKKRPRPWSLPPGLELEIRPTTVAGGKTHHNNQAQLHHSHRRNQKPIFEGHPSLHILPPFTTDEEEEEEEEEDNKLEKNGTEERVAKKKEGEEEEDEEEEEGGAGEQEEWGEKQRRLTGLALISENETGDISEKAVHSTSAPWLKSSKSKPKDAMTSHAFISSFQDDSTNLVTPFICRPDSDRDEDDENNDDVGRNMINGKDDHDDNGDEDVLATYDYEYDATGPLYHYGT